MKLSHKPKKSLGQNFLIDKNIVNKIIKIGEINNNKTVIEIGAGYGSLTKSISSCKPKKIIAIEKDKNLALLLKEKFKDHKNIKIINEDILDIVQNNFFEEKVVVFGNLPYNVSTKILASLILQKKWPPWYGILILMFQKEVAERILAKTKTKEFGRLSVLSNWRLEVKKHFDVSNNCFFPRPKIDSTVLSFKPKENYIYTLKNPKNLEKVTNILFSGRRKMINKNFKKLFGNDIQKINELNIDLKKRPQDLTCDQFYKIASVYERLFD
mgnify:CR=1 FL=1